MTPSRYVYDATADNFRGLVLENSDCGPVLVNYWSPRADPCMLLMPRLVRLADEFGGRFVLVRVNADECRRLAREYGVRSLPTVKVFRHGRVVDTLQGAESEADVRRFIQRHIPRASYELPVRPLRTLGDGDIERAVRLAAQAALEDPEDVQLPLDVAKMLMLQGRTEQAYDVLNALPEAARKDARISNLWSHLGFIVAAQNAPPAETLMESIAADPSNLAARYQLSAVAVIRDDYATAMSQLLEIARRDRGFRDDVGRKGLLALFELLGEDDAQVQRYRRQLQGAPRTAQAFPLPRT